MEDDLSPLYEETPYHSRFGQIRESDYGDREDVTAEHEELRHELEALDSIQYPPSSVTSGHATLKKRRLNALSLGLRKYKSKVRLLILLVAVWPFLSWAIIYVLFSEHSALFPKTLRDSRSTLFVVAHPDDECLFFAPSILSTVRRAKSHGALLVLSSGNHYGQGELRQKELKASCKQLGIREERCDVMDLSSVQDDPEKWWPTDTISLTVKQHVDQWMIETIVTFDKGGVSGHINHRAVSAAVTQLALSLNQTNPSTSSSSLNHTSPTLFVVKTVFVLRKYLGLYDLPLSFSSFIPGVLFGPSILSRVPLDFTYDVRTEEEALESERKRQDSIESTERGLLLGGLSDYLFARKAFRRHQSQFVWDRHLYMILSQYMFFNTIERIV
ncbi:putative deacetylase LmbE-like domain-containing protein [Phakopsora pachyrhizi]|uniref:N-acetylglucosaminylphosphatidylinositol deacetylase n=1 Tax=Phakopsora pachyrhizi TaxID=170000 RepID=A0AAV0BAK9_PHAPC|nr:putative deacetylase LmbE-like domain-containing protein [Phakopsora pachyrhizi]